MAWNWPTLVPSNYEELVERLNARMKALERYVVDLEPVACCVWNSSTQTITDSTQTALAFNSELFDEGGMHDTTTNNSRLTVPAGRGGIYLIIAQVAWVVASGLGKRQVGIRQDGSTFLAVHTLDASASNEATDTGEITATAPRQVAAITALAAGDYVECVVYHNAGANRTVSSSAGEVTWFAAAKIA